MRKFYLFLNILLALGGLQAVHAQDSSVCNAAFSADASAIEVTLRAIDYMPHVRHNWNFGDDASWSTDSVAIVHNYALPGKYLITQVVIDSTNHCRDTSAQMVTIVAESDSTDPATCNVWIQYSSDTAHQLYSFLAVPVFSGGANLMINWIINDTLVSDTVGVGQTLTRSLPAGPYTVCANLVLTGLSNDTVCTSQSCVTIHPLDSTSTPPPPDTCTIAFTAVPKDQNPNQYVFTVIDGEAYDSISWTIMGPDSSLAGPYQGPGFSYTFPDTGFYSVYVTAEKLSGCLVTNGQYVHIDSVAAPSGNFINSYPNPATTQVTLNVTLDKYTTVDIRVYNSVGGLVSSRSVSGYKGVNQITLPIANLPMGVYYTELEFGGSILRSKFQKL